MTRAAENSAEKMQKKTTDINSSVRAGVADTCLDSKQAYVIGRISTRNNCVHFSDKTLTKQYRLNNFFQNLKSKVICYIHCSGICLFKKTLPTLYQILHPPPIFSLALHNAIIEGYQSFHKTVLFNGLQAYNAYAAYDAYIK